MSYMPPNGPVCPSCGKALISYSRQRVMGFGGTEWYTDSRWECPDNCIITPRTVCVKCGAPMIVKEWKVPSVCSGCGEVEDMNPDSRASGEVPREGK